MAKYITKIKTVEGSKQIDYNALANKPDLSKYATVEQLAGASLGGNVLYLHTIRFIFLTSDSGKSSPYIDMDVILPYEDPTTEGEYQGMNNSSWVADFMRHTLFVKGGTIWGNGGCTDGTTFFDVKGVRLHPEDSKYWQMILSKQTATSNDGDNDNTFNATAAGYTWKRLRTMSLDGSSYFYADPNLINGY